MLLKLWLLAAVSYFSSTHCDKNAPAVGFYIKRNSETTCQKWSKTIVQFYYSVLEADWKIKPKSPLQGGYFGHLEVKSGFHYKSMPLHFHTKTVKVASWKDSLSKVVIVVIAKWPKATFKRVFGDKQEQKSKSQIPLPRFHLVSLSAYSDLARLQQQLFQFREGLEPKIRLFRHVWSNRVNLQNANKWVDINREAEQSQLVCYHINTNKIQ